MSKYLARFAHTVAFFSIFSLLFAPFSAFADTPGTLNPWATETTHLPTSMDQFPATVYGGYIYIFGGSVLSNGTSDKVYSAPLGANGIVGSFTLQNQMPGAVYRDSGVVYKDHIYVLGGRDGGIHNTIYSAALEPDGGVGAWTTETNAMPFFGYYLNALAYDDYLYIFGGDDNSGPISDIYVAPINGDGSVGTWVTATTSMPTTMEHAALFLNDDYVYYVGGIYNRASTAATSSVYSAQLSAGGNIGSWTSQVNTLPQAVYGASFSEADGYAFVIGGLDESNASLSTVYIAQLLDNGAIGPWVTSSSALPQSLNDPAAVYSGNYTYVMGGKHSGSFQNTIYSSRMVGEVYTLSFDTQGGSAVSDVSDLGGGATTTLPAAPTKGTDTLENWNTASDGTGTAYQPGDTYSMPSADTTLYAIWPQPQTNNTSGGNTSSSPHHSSSSGSIQSQVANLVAMGKTAAAQQIQSQWPSLFPSGAGAVGSTTILAGLAVRDLETGMTGADVSALQKLLNANGFILAAAGPGAPGSETTMFGALTRSALAKFQAANGVLPSAGYFGPLTRGKIKMLGLSGTWW